MVRIHAAQLNVFERFFDNTNTHVAQPVERAAVNRVYGGSNPSVGALRFDLLSSANGSGDLVLSQGMWVQLPPRALLLIVKFAPVV